MPFAEVLRLTANGQRPTMPQLLCTVRTCHLPLTREERRVICPRGHAFDIARSGYINMLQPQERRSRKPGDPAEVQVPALPGVHFQGQVDYLYPELTQTTRSLKVRVIVKNSGDRLRPGMFAAAHFRGTTLEQVLTVPSEAVIKTGTRSVVIVADDGTHFRPVAVRVGAEHGDRSEILEGLTLGQEVVASGQFLIDSEASLRGAFDNLAGASDTHLDTKPELMPAPGAQSSSEMH